MVLEMHFFLWCDVPVGGVGIGVRSRIFDPVPKPCVGHTALAGSYPGPVSTPPQGGSVVVDV